MRHEAYDALRALIVDGTLAPNEALDDHAIARWLGVSRMPVREALVSLAMDELVVIAPNRFTRVAPLDAPRAVEAHRLMALLEAEASAVSDADAGSLADLAETFRWALWRSDAAEAIAADAAFHAAMRSGAASLSATLVGRVEPIARRAQRVAWDDIAELWPETDHGRAVEAIRRGDPPAVRAALEGEWRQLGQAVANALRSR